MAPRKSLGLGGRSPTLLIVVAVTSVVLLPSHQLRRFNPHQLTNPVPDADAPAPPPPLPIDIDKICPPSLDINSQNTYSPPSTLMQHDEIYDVIKFWYAFNCPRRSSCRFASIGQHLLHLAIQRNETLLTVQVGAMDGKSNDPMYEMFMEERSKYLWGKEAFPTLVNWLPVLIEPVPTNYDNMKRTYADIARNKGLGCAVPIHAAVSYDGTKTECPFCRVNTAEDAPERCRELPDWMRLQIGTLDCDHSHRFFNKDFDLCVLQDPLPCSSIDHLLRGKNVSPERIAMLQIDIEGYEYILLEGFLKEVLDKLLPPIIHFEHKVMRDQDVKNPLNASSRLDVVGDLLKSRGYVFHDEGEDYLAIRIGYNDAAPNHLSS